MTLCQCDLPYITSVSALLARRARSGRPGRTSTHVHGEITKKNSDWSTSTCVHPDWSVIPWWNSNKKIWLVSQTMVKFKWKVLIGQSDYPCSLIGQTKWAHTATMVKFKQAHMCMVKFEKNLIGQLDHGEIQTKFWLVSRQALLSDWSNRMGPYSNL